MAHIFPLFTAVIFPERRQGPQAYILSVPVLTLASLSLLSWQCLNLQGVTTSYHVYYGHFIINWKLKLPSFGWYSLIKRMHSLSDSIHGEEILCLRQKAVASQDVLEGKWTCQMGQVKVEEVKSSWQVPVFILKSKPINPEGYARYTIPSISAL